MCASLGSHPDVAAPARYVTRPGARAWTPDGDRPDLPPATAAERDLCDAIAETHGHTVTDVALTYVEAGGRMVLAPALVEVLRNRGLSGLRRPHVNVPFTLRAVARELTPLVRDPNARH